MAGFRRTKAKPYPTTLIRFDTPSIIDKRFFYLSLLYFSYKMVNLHIFYRRLLNIRDFKIRSR